MVDTRESVPGTAPPLLQPWHLALIVLGPISLAIGGLFHPSPLSPESAEQWRVLHLVALPLFPLLAVMLWILLIGVRDGIDGMVAVAARVCAYVYAAFYTALDVLAGIANGAIVQYGAESGLDVEGVKNMIFGQGNDVLAVGTWAMIAACLLTGVVYVRRIGMWALPGALVLLVSAWSFRDAHIYPPRGVVTMLGFGVGALLLALPVLRERRAVTRGDVSGSGSPGSGSSRDPRS